MEPTKKLPIYSLIIDPNSDDFGLTYNSAVDYPAIEKTFMKFNAQECKFSVNQDRQIITGPMMIPDLPIYRNDTKMGEYYVFFTKETIWQMFLQWFRKRKTIPLNLMHDDGTPLNNAYMFEIFIVDRSRGILPPTGFGEMPDGTVFASYKIDDSAFWNEYIKTGIIRGFSIEGMFEPKYVVDKPQDQTEAVAQHILQMRETLALIREMQK